LPEQSRRSGAPINWIALAPTVAYTDGIGVMKRAPHPNAADLFYDFVLSDGQTLLAELNHVISHRRNEPYLRRFRLKFIELAAGPRSRGAARPRGINGRAARVGPARCGRDGAEGPGENGAGGMKPLCALLAVASLASPVAAQEPRSVLAGLAAYEGADRPQLLLEGARREGFLSLYTSFPPEDVATLNAAFEKKYGVKVRAWRAA